MLFLLGFAAIRRSKSSNQKAVASHPSMIINASGWVPQQFGTAKLAIRASCGG